jgi:hypothetical protein
MDYNAGIDNKTIPITGEPNDTGLALVSQRAEEGDRELDHRAGEAYLR